MGPTTYKTSESHIAFVLSVVRMRTVFLYKAFAFVSTPLYKNPEYPARIYHVIKGKVNKDFCFFDMTMVTRTRTASFCMDKNVQKS